jgi:serine beta-lactamase-like protein LACTB, mitochondrial
MTRRHAVFLAATAVGAVCLGAAIFARGSGHGDERRSAGACREWVAARYFGKEIAKVRPLVPRMQRAFGAPGVAVAIAADGKLVWSETCGFADRERGHPVRRTTQFRVGSVSKALTAATAGLLHQRGWLALDAEVQRYVPGFPRKSRPITLRQLGGHLAGIRHYEGAEAVNTAHYDSVRSSLAVFEADALVAKPGEQFLYSSYGFNLLGAAVEGAAGRPFAAVVEEALLTPLGMTRTSLDDGRSGGGRARFYEVTSNRRAVVAPPMDLSDRFPSGGLLSTAEDLARFGIGITDRAFLSSRTQAVLFTSQKTARGEATGYGFGFEVGESPFGRVVGHTGNVVGGTSFLLVHPRTRVVVAMTTNIGFVTVARPPRLGQEVPEPPELALPFIRRVLGGRT